MDHNLIPDFTMKASGLVVNDIPKTHFENPGIDNHFVSFDNSYLRIPLQSDGVFSYFHTRVSNERKLHECEKVFLTPDSSDWNPHCQSYERNEQSMLDFEGKMSEPSRRSKHQAVL